MSLKQVFFTFLIDCKCPAFGISNNDKFTSEIDLQLFCRLGPPPRAGFI